MALEEAAQAEAEANFESKHEFKAYLDGEVIPLALIHVGIDTVSIGGKGFEYLVKTGKIVKAGTPLLKFSKVAIKKAGHLDTAIFVITNPSGVSFKFDTGIQGRTGETVIARY